MYSTTRNACSSRGNDAQLARSITTCALAKANLQKLELDVATALYVQGRRVHNV